MFALSLDKKIYLCFSRRKKAPEDKLIHGCHCVKVAVKTATIENLSK